MPEVTTLQAAAIRGVDPATIRTWVNRGKLKPTGQRHTGDRPTLLFRESDVLAVTSEPGRPRKTPVAPVRPAPVERLAAVEAPPSGLPAGLRRLQMAGRFVEASGEEVGGGVLLGRVLIGSDWLRVGRSSSGVVYHEQAPWMDDDPDWMDNPAHAEILEVLRAA